MKKPVNTGVASKDQEALIASLLSQIAPGAAELFASVRKILRKRFPDLNELVYDYGRSLIIAYSPNERGADGVVGLDVKADGVRLVFTQGVKLPDPDKILQGKATQIRYIMLETGKELKKHEVLALLEAAGQLMDPANLHHGPGKLIIKQSKQKR